MQQRKNGQTSVNSLNSLCGGIMTDAKVETKAVTPKHPLDKVGRNCTEKGAAIRDIDLSGYTLPKELPKDRDDVLVAMAALNKANKSRFWAFCRSGSCLFGMRGTPVTWMVAFMAPDRDTMYVALTEQGDLMAFDYGARESSKTISTVQDLQAVMQVAAVQKTPSDWWPGAVVDRCMAWAADYAPKA
jgi:hypothetical protein